MPAIATLITDSGKGGGGGSGRLGGEAPSLVDDDGVLSGRREYLVNTHDEEAAMAAAGLPRVGEPWSSTLPTLKVVRVGPTGYRGGRDGVDGTGGWTIIPVAYAAPTGRGRLPAPVANLAFTEFEPFEQTVTVFFPVPDPTLVGPPDPNPINNGLGAPRLVTGTRLLVHRFYPASAIDAVFLRAFMPLFGRLNASAVTLPPLYTLGGQLSFQPGELLYHHMTPRVSTPNLIEVVHTLTAAVDHHFRWQPEDAQGRSTGVIVASQIIEAVNFPTL